MGKTLRFKCVGVERIREIEAEIKLLEKRIEELKMEAHNSLSFELLSESQE